MMNKKLDEVVDEDRIVVKRYYKVLIRLPSIKQIMPLYFTLLLVLFIVNKIYFIFMIIQTFVYMIYTNLSKTLLNNKRFIALSIVSTLYAIGLDYTFGFNIGLASSIALQTIVIVGLDGPNLISYLTPTIPYFGTITITQRVNKSLIVLGALTSIYTVILNYLIYKCISRYNVNGFSSFEIGKLFLENRLKGSKEIENVFEKLSKLEVIKPCLFISDKMAIAYTDLHYGPFYNTGSSELPNLMIKNFENKGYYVFVLHGAGSHDRNLPKSDLNQVIIDKFVDKLNRVEEGFIDRLHGIFHVEGDDNWEATGVVFEKTTLLFLSRPYGGIDDIPYHIQQWLDLESNTRDLGRILIIDSHNWELSNKPDYNALKTLLLKSIEHIVEMRKSEASEPLVRYACIDTDLEGLIGGRICGLELAKKDTNEKFILLYLRGNNMEKYLRNNIIRIVKDFYKDNVIVEVVSNDEHSETGIYSYTLYKPIRCKRGLENIISSLMKKISMTMYSSNWVTICFEDKVPLLQDGAYKLLNILRKTYPRTVILLIILLITTPFFAKLIQNMLI
ncbi:MAG: DUF2070 family protein [Desulfurococcaceae archaeon]